MKKYFLCQNESVQQILFTESENVKKGNEVWTMIAGGFNSVEELHEKCKILPESCKECSHLISTTYNEPHKSEMISRNICLRCNIWTNKLNTLPDPNCFVVNGGVYNVKPNIDGPGGFKGFGGREFRFIKNSVLTISHNVWFNGQVPVHFKDRIKDNATFEK